MRSSRSTGASTQSELLTLFDPLAFRHLQFRQMHVQRHELLAVIDDDAIAFVEEVTGQHDLAGIGCEHGRPSCSAIVEATMDTGQFPVERTARSEDLCNSGVQRRPEAS